MRDEGLGLTHPALLCGFSFWFSRAVWLLRISQPTRFVRVWPLVFVVFGWGQLFFTGSVLAYENGGGLDCSKYFRWQNAVFCTEQWLYWYFSLQLNNTTPQRVFTSFLIIFPVLPNTVILSCRNSLAQNSSLSLCWRVHVWKWNAARDIKLRCSITQYI